MTKDDKSQSESHIRITKHPRMKTMTLRVPPNMYKNIKRSANEHNQRISDMNREFLKFGMARDFLTRNKKKFYLSKEDKQELAELKTMLNELGNNVNQIAYVLNRFNKDFDILATTNDELKDMITNSRKDVSNFTSEFKSLNKKVDTVWQKLSK